MKRLVRKNIVLGIFIVLLIDIVIGYFLFKSRAFSHLAIWNIIESNKQEDFYWDPKDVPDYFYFGSDSDRLSVFRNELSPLVQNENDEFKIVLRVAKYVVDINSANIRRGFSLIWNSPEGMLRQIKEGANANCFPRSILFSTYLSSLGMKSRLWALENAKFNATAHTITEVYIKSLKKWVFIDVALGFYAKEREMPLSFLELREKLLDGSTNAILVYNISDEIKGEHKLPNSYNHLIKCVFLRANNNFIDKYNMRYGIFYVFRTYMDRFPDKIRRGVDYLFSKRDIFVHYVDRFSGSLRLDLIIAKLLFYFLVLSVICIGVILVSFSLVFLKHLSAINLSKKDTRHR